MYTYGMLPLYILAINHLQLVVVSNKVSKRERKSKGGRERREREEPT